LNNVSYIIFNFKIFNLGGKLTFGQVPLVEIDDLSLVQSGSIVRYFGKKANLLGDSLVEQTKYKKIFLLKFLIFYYYTMFLKKSRCTL
jgi:glutathione S-transferase